MTNLKKQSDEVPIPTRTTYNSTTLPFLFHEYTIYIEPDETFVSPECVYDKVNYNNSPYFLESAEDLFYTESVYDNEKYNVSNF